MSKIKNYLLTKMFVVYLLCLAVILLMTDLFSCNDK